MNAKRARRNRKLAKTIYKIQLKAWENRRPKWWQFWKLKEWKNSKPKLAELERKYKKCI